MLHPFGLQDLESISELVPGHAVLGIPRVVHDIVAQGKDAPRVEPAADGFWDGSYLFQEFDHGEIIQVDDGSQLVGFLHIFHRGIIGREHDFMALEPAHIGKYQFRIGRTVGTAAFFLHDPQDPRQRRGLHGKVFLEALVPGKSLVDAAHRFSDALFIIHVEWRRIFLCQFLDLFFGHKWNFFHNRFIPPQFG